MKAPLRTASLLSIICSVFLLSTMSGCVMRTIKKRDLLPAPEAQGERLTMGDMVSVRFRSTPERNMEAQTIRVDGNITLMGIGDVKIDGLTPNEATARVAALYKAKEKSLELPEVTVIVAAQPGRRVYVSGSVLRPGVISLPGRLTALEAIAEAGGFNMGVARRSKVLIIREVDGIRYAKRIDLEKAVKKPLSEPFYLAANDVVYVPRTGIVKWNQFIEQWITRSLPFSGTMTRAITSGGI